MTLTASTLNAALKVMYDGQSLKELVYNENQRPLMSSLKKFKGFEGTIYPLPILYEDGSGRSYDFATAQANVGSPLLKQWQIDVVPNYTVARITSEAILRSGSNKGSFISGLKLNMDSAVNRLANDLEAALFRDGSGKIGVVSSTTSTTVTLTVVDDIVNFWVGQHVVAAASTSASLNSATPGVVSKVDRNLGIITFSAAHSGTFAPIAGDSLFNEGDYTTASDRKKISGLAAWLPSSTPSATTFFNVDRTADPSRLAGVRVVGSSANIEESIISGCAALGRESSAVPDVAYMSFTHYRQLVNELGAKVMRDQKAVGQGGFQTLEVYGPRGVVKCIPSTFCPSGQIYLLTSNTWQLFSIGEPVRIVDQDGLKMVRMASADAFEVRVFSWSQLGCQLPGANAVITL